MQFHEMTVTDVRKTIRDAVVVSLTPKSGDFSFIQGQYLTFRRDFGGTEIRRSYSICAGRDEPELQVGIKKVVGGAFSTWANEDLRPGMVLEAMTPMGNFHVPLAPDITRHYLGFAGGSGITPVLSILKTVLSEEPQARFTLVYANRNVNTIMFREELEDLKNLHMGRLNVIHMLEDDSQEIDLFRGRVDGAKCAALFGGWIDIARVDIAFICGPKPMMEAISKALRAHGLKDEQIKYELFASSQPGRLAQVANLAKDRVAGQLTVVLDGAGRQVDMPPGGTLLDAALAGDVEAPYACKAGVCSTCKCRVLKGEVEMIANHALEDYEVRAGYALSCQAVPLTDDVTIDYDLH